MAESIQRTLKRIRPPRVKITYDVETGDSIVKKELPFIMGIMADLSGNRTVEGANTPMPYKEREFIFIDRDNFNDLLKDIRPGVAVELAPEPGAAAEGEAAEGAEGGEAEPAKGKKVMVFFENLDDFTPDALVGRIPELRALLDSRNNLQDLSAKLDANDDLAEKLMEIFQSPEQIDALLGEVDALKTARDGGDDAAAPGETLAPLLALSVKSPEQEKFILGMFKEALEKIKAGELDPAKNFGNIVHTLIEKVAEIDRTISAHVDAILHNPELQALEATWRGVHYLVTNTETGEYLKLRIFNATFKELKDDLNKAIEFDQSALFKKVYEEAYGTLGGEPFSALIHVQEYGRTDEHVQMLRKLAEVAAAAHTPLLTAAAPSLFDMNSFLELPNPRDLTKIFMSVECMQWRELRALEDSRYLNICLPHMLLRTPYVEADVETFAYKENVGAPDHNKYLWGNAAFAMARCITNAFALYKWTAAIRGVEGGGLLENLPVHLYRRSTGDTVAKIPTEVAITDRREKELSDLGFIALTHCLNSSTAAFFGGQSLHRPPVYMDDFANDNAKLSARLPYLLNASRFAHYIKAIMRDKVGSFASVDSVSKYLNNWISHYVLLSDVANQTTKAAYPLREARVDVTEVPGSPGAFKAVIYLRPHFQMEELDASIRLVASLPPPAA